MTVNEISSIVAATGCMVCSFSLGIHHIITSPRMRSWPPAVRWIRVVMFSLMAAMLWRAQHILFNLGTPAGTVPIEGALPVVIMAAYTSAMMLATLQHNYPSRLYRALAKLEASYARLSQFTEHCLEALAKSGAPAPPAPHGVSIDEMMRGQVAIYTPGQVKDERP